MVGLEFPKHAHKDMEALDVQFGHEDMVEGGLIFGLEYGFQEDGEVAVAFQMHLSCKKLEEIFGCVYPLVEAPYLIQECIKLHGLI